MKNTAIKLSLALAAFAAATTGYSQILITNNSSVAGQSSYDFGPVVVSAYFGAGAATPNALINSNNLAFLGVLSASGNINSINDLDGVFGGADQERLRLTLDGGYALSAFTFNFTRADGPLATDGIVISGFLADPGVTLSGGIAHTPVYSAGVLTIQTPWTAGTIHTVSFANLAASDGATLEFVVADSNEVGPVLATRSFTVQAVPEPSAFALLAVGLGLMGLSARARKQSR